MSEIPVGGGGWFRAFRTLPSRRTAIEDFPWEWLKWIEPNIQRGTVEQGDHWYWTGYEMKGRPMVCWADPEHGQMRQTASNFIVLLFWEFHPMLTADNYSGRGKLWYVQNACGYENCVNPQHLIPRVRFNQEMPHDW